MKLVSCSSAAQITVIFKRPLNIFDRLLVPLDQTKNWRLVRLLVTPLVIVFAMVGTVKTLLIVWEASMNGGHSDFVFGWISRSNKTRGLSGEGGDTATLTLEISFPPSNCHRCFVSDKLKSSIFAERIF
jgi:hypothetical protein